MKRPFDALVGAGAAGLATAIFARRACPSLAVVLREAAKRPGAKILVSGARARCATLTATMEFMNRRDSDRMVELLVALVQKLNEPTVAKIRDFTP